MMKTLLTIENKVGKVSLNDIITKWTADETIEEIGKLYGDKAVKNGSVFGEITACAEGALDTLEIEINSPGGSVLDGHRIYQELTRMKDRGVRVVAIINGLAASMGSVIAMAADEIRMSKGSRMMIHDASQSVHGTSEDHQRAANVLDSMSGEIADIYAEKSGKSSNEMRKMMRKETWFGAKDALEIGLVDAVMDGNKKAENSKLDYSDGDCQDALRKAFNMGLLKTLGLTSGDSENDSAEISELDASAIEAGLMEAKKEIDSLKAEHAIELAGRAETIEKLTAEHAEAITEKDGEIAGMAGEIENLTEQVETLKAEVVAESESAQAKANEMLAAAGHPPVDVTKTDIDEPQSDDEIIEKFNSMEPGDARQAFYQKHRKVIAG